MPTSFLKEITQREMIRLSSMRKSEINTKNYLIDEFQRTFWFQWDSFQTTFARLTGPNQTNYWSCDVKQSIYRWRGGEMKLFALARLQDEIRVEPLIN